MPVDVVVGGQYGGEGKGNISAYLVHTGNYDILVKTGGPNSSHTVGLNGVLHTYRMLPAGAISGIDVIVIPAGALIHIPTLFGELKQLNHTGELIIDPMAGVIEEDHINKQLEDERYKRLGSTRTGTGTALAQRALRRLKTAKDFDILGQYVESVPEYLHNQLKKEKQILLEGSQGYGLSNFHGDYPYSTSRDTLSTTFLSQAGIAPHFLRDVILVIKTFPTRNKPGHGTLEHELPDEFIDKYSTVLAEFGGGTYNTDGFRRRVGLFDIGLVRQAVAINGASSIALTGLDKLQHVLADETVRAHYGTVDGFIQYVEQNLGLTVRVQGWGPNLEDVKGNGN